MRIKERERERSVIGKQVFLILILLLFLEFSDRHPVIAHFPPGLCAAVDAFQDLHHFHAVLAAGDAVRGLP